MQTRKVWPDSPAHAAAISSAQTLGLHGRVADATETMLLTPRIAAANEESAFLPVIVASCAIMRFTSPFGFRRDSPRSSENNPLEE